MNKTDSRIETLLLTRKDVENLVTMKDAIEAQKWIFAEHVHGKTKSYPRVHIPFGQYNGSIGYMEASIDSVGFAVSKIASLFNDNPKNGLPRIIALITLNRINDGIPVAIMEGNFLTMLRTGAIGALAVEYLARKDSEIVGIIGAGIQGWGQLWGITEVRSVKKVKVYDISADSAKNFAEEATTRFGVEADVVTSPNQLQECDIIATATPAREPIIRRGMISRGTHVTSVGIGAGLGKKEVDYMLIKESKTVVDDLDVAKTDSLGEAFRAGVLNESDIYATIGEIVTGKKKGRTGDEITIFVSAGMAIQDLAVASLVYQRAVRNKIGTKFSFFG